MNNNLYVSIDVETTGTNPNKHQILEFAAIVDNIQDRNIIELELLPVCHFRIHHSYIYGNPVAIAMNHKNIKAIADKDETKCKIIKKEDAAGKFKNFLEQCGMYKPDAPKRENLISVAGKNFAGFDLLFLQKLDFPMIFRSRILDPAILYHKPEEDGAILPDMQTCLDRAGIEKKVSHTAVDDAYDIIRLLKYKLYHSM